MTPDFAWGKDEIGQAGSDSGSGVPGQVGLILLIQGLTAGVFEEFGGTA